MRKFRLWINGNWLVVFFAFLTLVVILFPWRNLDGVELWGYQLHTWHYNELGDFIGGITTPVLSFIGVFLLYKTYISQKTELKATKKALRLQQSTTSLFSMINVLENILSNLSQEVQMNVERLEVKRGRELLGYFHGQLRLWLAEGNIYYRYDEETNGFDEYVSEIVGSKNLSETEVAGIENLLGKLKTKSKKTGKVISADEYFKTFGSTVIIFFEQNGKGKNVVALTPYFRYIESIIDFINSEFVTQKEKDFYHKVFSSQFSNEELGLLYYYSMSFYPKKLFRKLVQSRFLRHLERRSLPVPEHVNVYRSKILHPMI